MVRNSDKAVCVSCGAVVLSDWCDLCGTPVAVDDVRPPVGGKPGIAQDVADESAAIDEIPAVVPVAETSGSRACPSCGASNRSDARFCDHCGSGFAPVSPSRKVARKSHRKSRNRDAPTEPRSEVEAQPRIGLYVAGAIIAVVVLYLLSVMSNQSSTPTQAPLAQGTPRQAGSSAGIDSYLPEDAGLTNTLSETIAAISAATDSERRQALREELVQAYARAGRIDLAGRAQEETASEVGTAGAWATAGNFHFDWMELQSGPERLKAAQRAARAYEKSLALESGNLDVRTDLGVAYLNDPGSPMLAIQNTNMVLEADSNHLQANFNKGVMLAQIGRTEEAIRLFEKVVTLSAPGEPAHDRALQVLGQLGAADISIGTSG